MRLARQPRGPTVRQRPLSSGCSRPCGATRSRQRSPATAWSLAAWRSAALAAARATTRRTCGASPATLAAAAMPA
ncbi:hypothetical protein WJX81_007415 [Elliptochloris bilobata]|uniref:Uncharacterized protein n=1 Tax=Elliptochloris bilobata TaxID=381761 RepID=A0AAW1RC40_9CHLO